MKNNHINSPRKHLNQKEQALSKKHQQRLDEMIDLAINQQENPGSSSTTPNDYLDQKAQQLAEKHQQRLDDISKQAIISQATSQYLDEKNQRLSQRYQYRLRKMTNWVINNHPSSLLSLLLKPLSFVLKPVPMMALASILAISVTVTVLFEKRDEQLSPHSFQANAKLPTWVKDTDVPVELLENLDFYVWLSQQNEFAQTKDKWVLAVAWYHQHCTGKRCSPRDIAEGFSGTVTHTGEL